MAEIRFDVPDGVFQAVDVTLAEFTGAVRFAAATHWYARGVLTMGQAAALAGLDLRAFLSALSRERQDIFAVDLADFQQDLTLLAQHRPQPAGRG